MTRTILLLLLLVCKCFIADAQLGAAAIEQYFREYQKSNLQEKLFVATDKEMYLAGEIIWFKVHYLEANTNTPLDVSRIAYLEVLDSDNRSVLQTKVSLSKGGGSGSIYLPSGLVSGNYTLRAYTNWMKNLDPEFYFHKLLTVYNTLKDEKVAASSTGERSAVQFFPEGGNLVRGLLSRVGFKAVDKNGKGLEFKGAVLNSKSDTLIRFQPSAFGIGSFLFTPQKGEDYRVVIAPKAGKSFTAALPEIFETGFVMLLEPKGDTIVVKVATNVASQDQLTLFIHSGREIKLNKPLHQAGGSFMLEVPKQILGDGVSHFTIFDERGRPVCERLHFKRPAKSLKLEASTDKREYGVRNKVDFKLISQSEQGSVSSDASYSVSVHKTDTLLASNEDILSYLWLSSEIKGRIENPAFYLHQASETALDHLMLTQGWRRFRWEDVLEKKSPARQFLPEIDESIINARVINSETKKPVAGLPAYLSIPSRNSKFYTAVSNENGELSFYTKPVWGSTELIAQIDRRVDSLARLEIISPFSNRQGNYALPPFDYSSAPKDLQEQSIQMQVRNTFFAQYLNRETTPAVDSIPFYTYADRSYNLDDYVRFTTMEEVLREYVPEISVAIRKKNYHLKVLDPEINEFYPSAPLILLDGVPVFDEGTTIIRYDPLKVKKLDVVNKRYFYGANMYDGIASFSTYKGDLSGFELSPNATVIDYAGIQPRREFYSPMYEGDKSEPARIPDHRTTLYWNPNGYTDQNGKAFASFYTSDVKGTYLVIVQGIDKTGRCGSATTSFTVK